MLVFKEIVASMVDEWNKMRLVCVDLDKILLPRQLYKCLAAEFSVNTAYIAIYMPVAQDQYTD